jgi:hypothetical protein
MKNKFCVGAAIYVMILLGSAEITAQVFRGESVEYHHGSKRWFTSSNGTSILQRDSSGSVSYFGTGLKASYGMEISQNTLFAIDGKVIYGYDLNSAAKVMTANLTGANFLNGLAHDGDHTLYATDFGSNKIYKVDVQNFANPVITTLVANTQQQPNGIVWDKLNQRLLFVTWGTNARVKAVDPITANITDILTTSLGSIDGIDHDAIGRHYLASWTPARITRYDANWTNPVTIAVPGGVSSPADIAYAEEIDTLGVPVGNGAVKFVGFAPVSATQTIQESILELNLTPNPAFVQSNLSFKLLQAEMVQVDLYSPLGVSLRNIHSGRLASGELSFNIRTSDLNNGIYHIAIRGESFSETIQLVVAK